MKAVHTIDHVVNTILRWIVMIMLSVMSVIVFAQVVFRIVHLSIPWSEELSKYLLCDAGISYWCWFLGSSKSLFSDYAGFEAIHGFDVCCYSGWLSFYADQSDYYNDLCDQGG